MNRKWITNVAVALVGAVVVWGLLFAPKEYSIYRAKKAVAHDLIDPSSAQFRSITSSKSGDFVCGEVNGKNKLGAYVGFKRFSVAKGGGAMLEPEPHSPAYPQWEIRLIGCGV